MADTCESGKTANAVCAGRWSTREVHTNPKSQCCTKLKADSVTIRFRVLPPPSRLRLQGASLARSFDLSRITDGTTAQTPAPHSWAPHLLRFRSPHLSRAREQVAPSAPDPDAAVCLRTVFRGKARSRAKRLSVPGQRAGPAALPALGHACLDVPWRGQRSCAAVHQRFPSAEERDTCYRLYVGSPLLNAAELCVSQLRGLERAALVEARSRQSQ